MPVPNDIAERVLGSRSRTRVLRVLHGVQVPMNASQIARASRLSKPAVGSVLGELRELGLVQSAPAGRAWVHWLVRENYYVQRMVAPVFEAEAAFSEELEAALRESFSAHAVSVVLFGSRARMEESPGSDVDVALVVADAAGKVVLQEMAADQDIVFRKRFGAGLSPLVYTVAEAASLPDTASALYDSISADGLVVSGLSPAEWRSA